MARMKSRLVMLATLAAGLTRAGTVTVWLDQAAVDGPREKATVAEAREVASRMFDTIGVVLRWRMDAPPACGEDVRMFLADNSPRGVSANALGYAILHPPGCPSIRLLYYRIVENRKHDLQVCLLAHVMVHEITHVLEGTARHGTGVMKASWDEADFRVMMFHPLPFAEEDIRLLRAHFDALAITRALE